MNTATPNGMAAFEVRGVSERLLQLDTHRELGEMWNRLSASAPLEQKAGCNLNLTRSPVVGSRCLQVFSSIRCVWIDIPLNVERIEGIDIDAESHLILDWKYLVQGHINVVVVRSKEYGL